MNMYIVLSWSSVVLQMYVCKNKTSVQEYQLNFNFFLSFNFIAICSIESQYSQTLNQILTGGGGINLKGGRIGPPPQ